MVIYLAYTKILKLDAPNQSILKLYKNTSVLSILNVILLTKNNLDSEIFNFKSSQSQNQKTSKTYEKDCFENLFILKKILLKSKIDKSLNILS